MLFSTYAFSTFVVSTLVVSTKVVAPHSFKKLHKISNRAMPEMWFNYSAACGMFNVITTCIPENTLVNMTENCLYSERIEGLQLTRSNKLKIDFNCISNCLQNVSSAL